MSNNRAIENLSLEDLLRSAILKNQFKSVTQILDAHPALALNVTRYSDTPFQYAAQEGCLTVVQHIVENLETFERATGKTAKDIFNNSLPLQNTPLLLAAEYGKTNVVDYFLKQTIYPFESHEIETAFLKSVWAESTDTLKCFLQQCKFSQEIQNKALGLAANNNKIKHVKTLFEYGKVNIHAPSRLPNPDLENLSSLEIAIFWNYRQCIKTLAELFNTVTKEQVIEAYYKFNLKTGSTHRERIFHHKMQHPLNGVIDLSNTNFYEYLPIIIKYFIPVFDEKYFLRDAVVHTIDFSHINLTTIPSPLSRSHFFSTSPPFLEIRNLIMANPNVKTLNLTNTNLSDDAANILCGALDTNTHLTDIILNDNPGLSVEMKEKLYSAANKNRVAFETAEERIDFTGSNKYL